MRPILFKEITPNYIHLYELLYTTLFDHMKLIWITVPYFKLIKTEF